jgi:6-phosphogluconolactonase
MGSPAWRTFETRDALDGALAADISQVLRASVGVRGHALLVVPGGSTPVPLFHRLAATELPWQAVRITVTDERWVPVDSADSNEGLVRRHLAKGLARAARVSGLYQPGMSPEEAVAPCEDMLSAFGSPFDVVVLGVGEDGHVASLFPGLAASSEALNPHSPRRCIAVRPPPAVRPSGLARLSLTLAALLSTRYLRVLIAGEPKRKLLLESIAGAAHTTALPITAVLTQDAVPVELFWCPEP